MATFCRIGRSLDVCRLLSRKVVLVPTRVFSDVPDSHPLAEPSLSVGSTTTHIGVLFDTHKFVKDLQKSGLSPTQSECVMTVLRDALTSSLTAALRGCPSHSDIDLMSTQLQMKVSTASTDIEMLKKTEVATLKKDSEETKEQLKKLKGMFQDEMQRIKSGISLDFNLEKSRMREETTLLHQRIKDTDNKLATMVADMNTKIESQKLEMIKYLAGGIATIITLMLSVVMGIWRLSR